MPEICRFYGIIIAMYINEHNPPHFHIKYENYRAMITIERQIITGTMPAHVLRKVGEWLELHKDELLDNWERLRDGKQPNKIEPLK